ncbi:MAG: hypothetical protein Unbinned3992contig1000_21 [Prokaryotic dsDNA virus sp.]|nr:MAG: hypothetical protein Unbinned3992contig1000_21 [Prokaryotic dsDNA virus sp.]|tara:strand:+ start:6490 stop:7008 length:519 start_codon:yes stop_codon:yes gene_type:complete
MRKSATIHQVPVGFCQAQGQPVDLSYAYERGVIKAANISCSDALRSVLNTWRALNPDVGINYDAEPGTDERIGSIASFQISEFVPYVPARVVLNNDNQTWHYASLEDGDIHPVGYQQFYFLTPTEGAAAGRFVAYPDGTVEVYACRTTHMAPVAVRNLLHKYFTEGQLEVVC